jgi:hypothetical protein
MEQEYQLLIDFVRKHNIGHSKIGERPWGSYDLAVHIRGNVFHTPEVFGYGFTTELAVAIAFKKWMESEKKNEVQHLLGKELYDELEQLLVDMKKLDELRSEMNASGSLNVSEHIRNESDGI